jgi:hypothetical protein
MKPKSKKPAGPRARRGSAPSADRADDPGRPVVIDYVQSRIEAFNEELGGGVAVRKDAHGYTLIRIDTGTPLARLRPRENGDRFEVLYWSAFRERWRPVGAFGGMVLSLVDALEFIAKDPMDCFWH